MNEKFEPTVLEVQAYRALECKNISLEEFVKRTREEKFENGRTMINYDANIPLGPDRVNNSVLTKPRTMSDSVPRCIILDGANIMHCGSIYKDERANSNCQSIPDVAALLSVLRYFLVNQFDVFAVISRKYQKPDATNFASAIELLVKNDLCVIAPNSNLDDTVALEFAAQTNGLVVTSDQFRDHMKISPRHERLVNKNRLGIAWGRNLPENQRNTRSRKGNDYVANRTFKFVKYNGDDMSIEEVSSKLYVTPMDISFEISKERHELCEPIRKKDTKLALLNRLILEALSVCKNTAEEILTKPFHDPAETHRQAVERAVEDNDCDDYPEIVRGSEMEYVAEMDDGDNEEW